MFSRFVFHITGVVVTVLALHSCHVIPTKSGLKIATEQKKNYYQSSRTDYCMSDFNIQIAYIGQDIIAICKDWNDDYAFYARHITESGEYHTRIQSTDGLTTTGRFKKISNARQMVTIALSKHFEVQQNLADNEKQQVKKEKEPTKALH